MAGGQALPHRQAHTYSSDNKTKLTKAYVDREGLDRAGAKSLYIPEPLSTGTVRVGVQK